MSRSRSSPRPDGRLRRRLEHQRRRVELQQRQRLLAAGRQRARGHRQRHQRCLTGEADSVLPGVVDLHAAESLSITYPQTITSAAQSPTPVTSTLPLRTQGSARHHPARPPRHRSAGGERPRLRGGRHVHPPLRSPLDLVDERQSHEELSHAQEAVPSRRRRRRPRRPGGRRSVRPGLRGSSRPWAVRAYAGAGRERPVTPLLLASRRARRFRPGLHRGQQHRVRHDHASPRYVQRRHGSLLRQCLRLARYTVPRDRLLGDRSPADRYRRAAQPAGRAVPGHRPGRDGSGPRPGRHQRHPRDGVEAVKLKSTAAPEPR